ncbi:MAG TPA: Atxe2 family lasso peptide isopeptidase [Sphingomicrobium sp.]
MACGRNLFAIGSMAVAGCVTLATSASSTASVSNRELVEVVDIDSLSASPNGRFAVFRTVRADIVRNSYVLRWHSVDLASGSVRDIGGGGDPIYLDPGSVQAEAPVWVEEGTSIVVRALVDGAVGLWKADVRSGQMEPLIVRDADVEEYAAGEDGRSLAYKVGPSRDEIRRSERAEYDGGILVDSSVDLSQNLFRGGSINGRMSTQRLVGYWFVKDGLLWRSPRQQRRFDLLSGDDTAVGAPQAVQAFDLASARPPSEARSAKGHVASSAWDGRSGKVSVRFADGRDLTCRDPLCSSARVASMVWRPGSAEVLITFMDRERRQSLFLWSTDSNHLRKVADNDGLLGGGRRHMYPCAVSAAAALCVAAGPASPPRVERIDLDSGRRQLLFDPNADLRLAYRPTIRNIRWEIGGGRDAAGVLMLPARPADKPAPLYVNYYSCEGFLRGGEGDEWPIPALLDAGFVIACINAVPSTGPQDALEEYRTGLAAVRALVGKLSGDGIVDRSKVAMGGLSFGSEVAFWVASHSDLLAVLSVSSPQPEPANYWLNAMPGSDIPGTTRRVWGYGAPEETPERWLVVSPALNAGKVRIPVLFQMPEMEARRVPELYARLARLGTPTELHAFPDEMHLKVQPRHRLAVYERNLDWFRYWLEDHRNPDPDKAGQYRRWDQLKQRWQIQRSSASNPSKAPAPPAR